MSDHPQSLGEILTSPVPWYGKLGLVATAVGSGQLIIAQAGLAAAIAAFSGVLHFLSAAGAFMGGAAALVGLLNSLWQQRKARKSATKKAAPKP